VTIGTDLGDRWSFYYVLDESRKVILEERLATRPEAMKQTFAEITRSLGDRNAFPWINRRLTELVPGVIVAHAEMREVLEPS